MAMHKTMKQYTIGLVLAAGLSVGLANSHFDVLGQEEKRDYLR